MWRGWEGDLCAALVGLALVPALFFAVGGAAIAYQALTCDDDCQANGDWLAPLYRPQLDVAPSPAP